MTSPIGRRRSSAYTLRACRTRVAAGVVRVAGVDTGPRPVYDSALRLSPATLLPELSKAISPLSSTRAVGMDGVPLHAIVNGFPSSARSPPCHQSLHCNNVTGVFPTAWKLARVTPVHKSGDRSDLNNFRPISIMSVLSQITKKATYIACVLPI